MDDGDILFDERPGLVHAVDYMMVGKSVPTHLVEAVNEFWRLSRNEKDGRLREVVALYALCDFDSPWPDGVTITVEEGSNELLVSGRLDVVPGRRWVQTRDVVNEEGKLARSPLCCTLYDRGLTLAGILRKGMQYGATQPELSRKIVGEVIVVKWERPRGFYRGTVKAFYRSKTIVIQD